MSVYDDTETYWQSASDRLAALPLHHTHQWVIPSDGDCWAGEHSIIRCVQCHLAPFHLCYFDLPHDPKRTAAHLRTMHVKVGVEALQPCPLAVTTEESQ